MIFENYSRDETETDEEHLYKLGNFVHSDEEGRPISVLGLQTQLCVIDSPKIREDIFRFCKQIWTTEIGSYIDLLIIGEDSIIIDKNLGEDFDDCISNLEKLSSQNLDNTFSFSLSSSLFMDGLYAPRYIEIMVSLEGHESEENSFSFISFNFELGNCLKHPELFKISHDWAVNFTPISGNTSISIIGVPGMGSEIHGMMFHKYLSRFPGLSFQNLPFKINSFSTDKPLLEINWITYLDERVYKFSPEDINKMSKNGVEFFEKSTTQSLKCGKFPFIGDFNYGYITRSDYRAVSEVCHHLLRYNESYGILNLDNDLDPVEWYNQWVLRFEAAD